MKHSQAPWLDCGEGILQHPGSGRALKTRVVEAKGFGRVFEVYDYSNEPDYNFRLILAAPALLAMLQHSEAMLRVQADTARNYAQVRDHDANIGLAEEHEVWANTFASVIEAAGGETCAMRKKAVVS